MYIKKIVLEGFKSYGTRTEISGFDPEFNAITGLNGTGKSNILDSICFVMGISNLSQVRANSLNELVYKSGQAGITRASVSIFFDNSDTAKSPINYEQYDEINVTRQIVIGGKNRYMINGVSVNRQALIDFFSSIHLNVNNPHFLIMQGRITKVLNMKPPEILSMIEEAAGTSMYETKKNDAQKTIVKKDGKLREINDMVADQINPKMQRLKEERSQYAEYQRVVREYESFSKQFVVQKLLHLEGIQSTRTNELKEARVLREQLNSDKLNSQEKIKSIELEIGEIQKIKDMETGGKLYSLECDLKEAEKIEAKELAVVKSAKDSIANESKHCKQIQKSVEDDEKILNQKKTELCKAQATFDKLLESQKEDAEALIAAQKKLQAVSSGLLENTDGENATLQDQLMDAKQLATAAETEMKKCALKIQQDKKDLESKKPLLKKTEMTFAQDKKDLEEKERELKSLKDNLSKCNYDEGALEIIQEKCRNLIQENRRCEDIVNNFTHRYPQLNFTYRDPEPNFDRRKVKGLLCKLFSVKDEKFARALQSAAGGKLYNVVVDNDTISAKLIEKGQLQKRTTFAPLNKIQGYKMDASTIRRVKEEYGEDNVFLAQSLVSYNPEYENVMSWTFGQTLICPNIDVAEKICFRYKKKTITLDGDVFDPQGVISGGAVDKSQPILLALIEYQKAEAVWLDKKKEIDALNDQIRKLTPVASSYESMKEKIEVRTREVEMVRARLEQTSHFQLQSELKALQDSIDANEAKIQECRLEVKEKSAKAAELEYKMKNINAIREKEVSSAEAELKKAKKKAEESRNKWKLREQEFETLNLEIQELTKAVELGKEQIQKSQETIVQMEDDLNKKLNTLTVYKEEVKVKKEAVKVQKDAIAKQNSLLQSKITERDKSQENITSLEISLTKNAIAITKLQKDIEEIESQIKELRSKNKWLNNDQEYVNLRGTTQVSDTEYEELEQKVCDLKTKKDEMSKFVNLKGVDVLGNQEEKFNDVMTKKEIIEEDRSKILSVIEELDLKKEEVIRRAWDKVNHDFHSILSSLLPSAQAKLKPVDGKDFMDGLEVKVGFGGLWKESLDELSGGQRSLVALSLILAMLLFNPAPLYILDEVDAALDPSHTQNIGQMLKTHFKQSQFLVVSLKDGMFNNANVIFRTAFVDGMSTVIRTSNTSRR